MIVPALKIAAFLLFADVFVIYLDTRKHFGGNVKSFIDFLCLFALFMAMGSLLRYFGDGTDFGSKFQLSKYLLPTDDFSRPSTALSSILSILSPAI